MTVTDGASYPGPGRRGAKWTLWLMAATILAVSAVAVLFERPSLLIAAAGGLGSVASAFVILRRGTEVTPSFVRVRGNGLRGRTVRRAQIADAEKRTSVSPVRLYLHSGDAVELPGVDGDVVSRVRAVLGLAADGEGRRQARGHPLLDGD